MQDAGDDTISSADQTPSVEIASTTTTTTLASKNELEKLKEDDNASSASSASSEHKLKIDIEDEPEVTTKQTNAQINSKETQEKEQNNKPAQEKEQTESADGEAHSKETAEATTTTPEPSKGRQRKKRDLGLDGGYWSTISPAVDSKPKRQRTTVERLNLSILNASTRSNLSADDSVHSIEDEAQHSFQIDENSVNSESTTTSKTNNKDDPASVHYVLFRSKIFLAVRNDTGSFFLCQTVNKIYDDSKRCKIQWLEETNEENKYKFGYVDFIDPATIITKVKVNKVTTKKGSNENNYYYEIVKEDLDKVKSLLDKALHEGGITVEFQSSESDTVSDKEAESKKENNKKLSIEDVDLFDKEDDEDVIKKPKSKNAKTSKSNDDDDDVSFSSSSSSSETSFDSSDLTDSSSETPAKKSKKDKTPTKSSEKSKKITKKDEKPKEKSKLANSSNIKNETLKTITKKLITPDKLNKPKPVESRKLEENNFKKPIKPVSKKPQNDDDDTDELDSSGDEPPKKVKNEKSPQFKKPQDTTPSSAKQTESKTKSSNQQTPNLNGSKPSDDHLNQIQAPKKRKLLKVVSNRNLETNSKVTIYAKDPFFEEDNESTIPYISPYVQSKLAFKALHLGSVKLLVKLINDLKRVSSVHVSKSICNKWTPAQYALYLENRDALEILIDNYVDESLGRVSRVAIPENMFQKFTTGVYNPKSLGIRNIRPLTESRGVKEGNNALTKDYDEVEGTKRLRNFFSHLFDLALEYGVSNELFDFILAKWESSNQRMKRPFYNDIYNNSLIFIYEKIVTAIIFGNRKLAAHVLKNAPSGHGFNAVHLEVLNADNDADLKCQLRANMCTKKPFANDLVTPIHCACINSNVKYLKTLLSITQDYNIADKRGRKPVHYAAVCEGLSPLEYLITRVSPYELDSMGSTPLHYACLAGRTANVEMLLSHAKLKQEDDATITTEILMDNKYGIGGINKPNKRGQLPLHLAISKNHYDCVKVLIKYGCNIEYSLSNSMGKITPLMYAVQLGHQKIVQLLVDNNAKIEARDRFQRTASIHASMCGHARTLSYLLYLGANPNVCDSSGNSCLHYACAYGWFYCIRVLLDAGAHVNVVNDWKLTPFGAAFLKGHVGICDYLLETYPKQIDINFRTENGETLVMLAVSSASVLSEASVDQLDYIVNKLGGNCQLVDSRGCNAFHYLAANAIDRDALEEQLKETCQDSLVDESYAKQEEIRDRMAQILLRNKCNPNVENNEFETPFVTAVLNSNHSFAKYLFLSNNSNLITSKRGLSGKTLLSVMAEKCVELDTCKVILSSDPSGSPFYAKYLGEFEQMARMKEENGLSPFQIACVKISDELKSPKSASKLAEHTVQFVKFLYAECKANPNEPLLVEINAQNNKLFYGADKFDDDELSDSVDVDNFDKEFDDDQLSKHLQKLKNFYQTLPLFELVHDKSCDLLEDLISLMNSKQLTKFNFNYYDKTGATLLLKAVLLKQSRFALKLVELNCFSPDDLLNQICKNRKYYLNESVLQLAVRNQMTELVEKLIDTLTRLDDSKASLLVKFLSHENAFNQNFLHSLAQAESRHLFSRSFLFRIFSKLSDYLARTCPNNNLLFKLCSAKDTLERTPLHLCLINFDQSTSNIDLEMFLLETLFSFTKVAPHEIQNLFHQVDFFHRLPLHYLFYDSKKFQINSFKSHELYKLNKNFNTNQLKMYFGKDSIQQIDPVELLSLISRQMFNLNLDLKDKFGYTPLHYAAVRGATISCTLLASHGCNVLNPSQLNNTPLSSAIYYKRESCVLALMRSCFSETNKQASLNDFYYLNDTEVTDDDNTDWCSLSSSEKDLYPLNKLPLYKLIISHKWEGVSWLVLDELAKYGLTPLEVIQACLNANEFSLASRLLTRYEAQDADKITFKKKFLKSSLEHSQTLLHLLAQLDLTRLDANENINLILSKLFETQSQMDQQLIDEFIQRRDKFGSTALHYACQTLNFVFIDFILEYLNQNKSLKVDYLLAQLKDSNQQSAYSLLFWQIGRVTYTKTMREKIKIYSSYVNERESSSRACFPVQTWSAGFIAGARPPGERIIRDYPSVESSNRLLISPLLYAVNRQDVEMCKFLVREIELDVNTCDSNKTNTLMYAIQTNNLRLCQLLLNQIYEDNQQADSFNKQTNLASKQKLKTPLQMFKVIQTPRVVTKPTRTADENNSESSEEEENEQNDEYSLDETTSQETHDLTASPTKFKLRPNLVLNHLDSKQRTIFHYLACSLEYGSFSNSELCKLLFTAFNSVDEACRAQNRVPSLSDFLKRVDSNVLTAADYALRNGNIILYEEIQRVLQRPMSFDEQKITKFHVNDKYFTSNAVPNYSNDSEMYLKKCTENEAKINDADCFKVDPLSNMSRIGSLVWDQKHNVPYDVLLTKTDVSYGFYGMHNFYKMQLITQTYNHLICGEQQIINGGGGEKKPPKFDETQMCVLFTRWGRIGDVGQYQRTPFATFKEAKDEFCKLFKQKTANDFTETCLEKRKEFESKAKRYALVSLDLRRKPKLKEIDFRLFNNDESSQFDLCMFRSHAASKSYKEFFSDLLDVNFLKSQIDENHLSPDYLPLSRLSRDTIDKAAEILNRKLRPLIEKRMELEKVNKKENIPEYMSLLDLLNKHSNEFYELIPQMNYNYEKLPPISTEKQLDEQLCTISKLTNAQIAIRILMGAKQSQINPFDYVYRSLNSKLELLEPSLTEAKYILKYICPSREASQFRIKRIFKYERSGEQERFDRMRLASQQSKFKNRYMLWHGSGTENVLSILSKGLLKGPHDAKWTGQRLGKGIYFSDSFEASAGYCSGRTLRDKSKSEKRCYMFLCEVALGNLKELRTVHDTTDSLPDGYDSVKLFGRLEPDPSGDVILPNGAVMPMGERVQCKLKPGEYRNLNDHQYVVYNEAQVCIRYVVQFTS